MAALSTKSAAEDLMEFHLKTDGYGYERQFRFHQKRLWKTDFAIWEPRHSIGRSLYPTRERFLHGLLILEVEGVTYYGGKLGRHQRRYGVEGDCEKYNELTMLGYPLIRVTQHMVKDLRAITYVNRFFRDTVGPELPQLPDACGLFLPEMSGKR